MARYQITGPDGKTYEITAPDEASEEDVLGYMRNNMTAQPKAEQAPPTMSRAEAFGRGALQGLTFNTSDEIYAGGRAALGKLLGNGDTYDNALNEVRGANRRAEEEYPGTMLAGEVTGGVVPAAAATVGSVFFPGLAPAAATTNTKTAAQAASLGSRILKGAKIGAPIGAAYGAGAYEGAPDETLAQSAMGRVGAGAAGGVAGGIVGGVMTPAIDVIAGTTRAAINQVRAISNPERFARQKYGEALARSNHNASGADLRAELNSLGRASPNAIVGDAGGDPVKTLVRTAVNRPNAENERFLQLLDDRQGKQWAEIENNIASRIGDPDAFKAVKKALETNQAAEAHPAYKAAFEADFEPSSELWALFEQNDKGQFFRPTMGSIVNRVGRDLSDKYGSNYANWTDRNGLRFIQKVKQELDKQIGQAEKGVAVGRPYSADKNHLEALLDLRTQFADGIKKSRGDGAKLYVDADSKWSNAEALKRAMDLGRSNSQKTDDVISASMADLNPAEQQHYKLGLARGLADKNRVGNKMNDRIGRDWRDPQDEFRIDAMMNPSDAGGFRAALEAMEKARDLRRAATGNSTTAKQLLSNEDAKRDAEKVIGAVSAAKNLVSGNWSALMTQARNATKARIEGINPRVAEEILKIASRPAQGTPKSIYIDRMVEEGKKLAADQNLSNAQRDRLILMLIRAADAGISGTIRPGPAPN